MFKADWEAELFLSKNHHVLNNPVFLEQNIYEYHICHVPQKVPNALHLKFTPKHRRGLLVVAPRNSTVRQFKLGGWMTSVIIHPPPVQGVNPVTHLVRAELACRVVVWIPTVIRPLCGHVVCSNGKREFEQVYVRRWDSDCVSLHSCGFGHNFCATPSVSRVVFVKLLDKKRWRGSCLTRRPVFAKEQRYTAVVIVRCCFSRLGCRITKVLRVLRHQEHSVLSFVYLYPDVCPADDVVLHCLVSR